MPRTHRMTDADPLLPYRFTVRQRQVLRRIGLGMTDAEIAADLDIAQSTVRVYVTQLRDRIGLPHLPAKSAVKQFLNALATD